MRGDLYSNEIQNIFDDLLDLICDGIESGELCDGKVVMTIAGSAPLIYNEWIPYGTDDIDCLSCTSTWLSQRFPAYNINKRINSYGDSWAYNYEDRLVLLYTSEYLDVYQMCLEDLIFMKLGRWSDNDIEDLASMVKQGVSINFDFLEYLAYNEEESRGAGMSDFRYAELLVAYDDFLLRMETGRWNPKDELDDIK